MYCIIYNFATEEFNYCLFDYRHVVVNLIYKLFTMGESEEFNTLTFEKKLMQLKDTQESIQGLSSWCLKQRSHHKKIVASWLNVLKRVKVEQRLVLFYLANDVIQYSKRKNYEFVESWGLNLQKATPLVRLDMFISCNFC